MSLDGYIARQDGSIDWLTTIPNPEKGDYGYAELLDSIGTTIMGRKTYEEILGFGIEWPYGEYDSYIVTRGSESIIRTPRTHVINGDLEEAILKLKADASKDIWLIGGGQLASEFIRRSLVDTMIISVIPKIIGRGIPLFVGATSQARWILSEATSFDTGVVNLTYIRGT
jgi:dihydrofolate reductase